MNFFRFQKLPRIGDCTEVLNPATRGREVCLKVQPILVIRDLRDYQIIQGRVLPIWNIWINKLNNQWCWAQLSKVEYLTLNQGFRMDILY